MAANTGKGFRIGSVQGKSQVFNPQNEKWVKRGEDGKFESVKLNGEPFKGVAKEPDGRKE